MHQYKKLVYLTFCILFCSFAGQSKTDRLGVRTLVFNITSVVHQISCNGLQDGSIDLTVSGTGGPFYYNWSNGASSQDISGLHAGAYHVTVTDQSSSSQSLSFQITEPESINITINNVDPVSCVGGSDGAIYISIVGGYPPYSFDWGGGYISEDLIGMPAGVYTINILDSGGCTFNGTLNITEPSQALVVSVTSTDVSCFGGSDGIAVSTASGGVGGYTYSWSNGSGTSAISSVEAGSYVVSVIDTYGCLETATVDISQPLDSVIADVIVNDVTCFGYADGGISVLASGGTAPYSFQWSNASSGGSISGLTAGNYQVTISDANGCELIQEMIIEEPDSITISGFVEDVICYGETTGNIQLTVVGGASPYSFLWSNNASSIDNMNIPAGNYSVQVVDNNNCTYTGLFEVDGPPSAIDFNYEIMSATCTGVPDGYIHGDVSGGVPPYSYSWSTGESSNELDFIVPEKYSLTVVDDLGCEQVNDFVVDATDTLKIEAFSPNLPEDFSVDCANDQYGIVGFKVLDGTYPVNYSWSNGGYDSTIQNVGAGMYTVSVIDAMQCFVIDTIEVTQPGELIVNGTRNNPYCPGRETGSVSVIVGGGTQPYYVLWNTLSSRPSITDLAAGVYRVTVTDARGCVVNDTYTIYYTYDECLTVPNMFSPNNDGYNDFFEVEGNQLYPEIGIEIYNSWGMRVYSTSDGMKIKWDGTANGKELPVDTYYYILRLNDGFEPITGDITLKR